MAKIIVMRLFRSMGTGICGASVTLVFYKDGERVHEEVFSGKISESVFVREVELPEHDRVIADPSECGVNFAYSIDYAAPWNGEGLPPVGLEVEIKLKSTRADWCPATVLFCQDDALVIAWKAEGVARPTTLSAVDIRPIRTAEQIAAEEREKCIDEMSGWTGKTEVNPATERLLLERLYDAGYRKVGQ